MLLLSQDDVVRTLSMAECVEAVDEALRAAARGDVVLPVRTIVWLPDRHGLLGVMPGYLGAGKLLGVKAITVMPGNHGTAFDSHQGVVLLFEAEQGRLLSILDATAPTLRSWARASRRRRTSKRCASCARSDGCACGAGTRRTRGPSPTASRRVTASRWSRPLPRARPS